ncbi:MAG: 30S ribosome-binding factor RbfA [Proteobacteria bacterium]|nr:30S ribosome-binding factor RbfA [Pseudomonadota bacterium]
MAKEFSRARRIEQQILRELAQLLRFECKDQRLAWVTPVDVRLSSDLSVASIYVGILGKNADEAAEIMKVLNQAAGYFRTEIGKRMMLRITPQLRFFFDSVEEEAQKVDALLRKAAVISSEMPADAASETDKG